MAAMVGADDPGLVRALQEHAARALPAAVVDRRDGWWLRHTDSGAWWASTVLPHGDTPAVPPDGDARAVLPDGDTRAVLPDGDARAAELLSSVRAAEEFYAGRGTPVRFQVSPGACPAELDDLLAARGYRLGFPMSLQAATTSDAIDRLPADGPRTRVDPEPTDAWFETWRAVHAAGGDPAPERDLLRRVDRPSGYVSVLSGTRVVAVGRAVAASGWAGVFGMATLPDSRGQGAAGAVLAALARWARDHGADHLYLQVEADNPAAQRLYQRAGFTTLCHYHYRTAPTTPDPHPARALPPPLIGPF